MTVAKMEDGTRQMRLNGGDTGHRAPEQEGFKKAAAVKYAQE